MSRFPIQTIQTSTLKSNTILQIRIHLKNNNEPTNKKQTVHE